MAVIFIPTIPGHCIMSQNLTVSQFGNIFYLNQNRFYLHQHLGEVGSGRYTLASSTDMVSVILIRDTKSSQVMGKIEMP